MYESIKQGKPVTIEEQDTLADSLLGGIGMSNQNTFQMVQQYEDNIFLVNEKEIADGMVFVLSKQRMMIEGAAATGIEAILNEKVPLSFHVVDIDRGCRVDYSVIGYLI